MKSLLLQKITRIQYKKIMTTQMVLTKLNIAWAYFDMLILIKDYPISILSINTIQIWQ
jgi:hypothetical protein